MLHHTAPHACMRHVLRSKCHCKTSAFLTAVEPKTDGRTFSRSSVLSVWLTLICTFSFALFLALAASFPVATYFGLLELVRLPFLFLLSAFFEGLVTAVQHAGYVIASDLTLQARERGAQNSCEARPLVRDRRC